jgi:hypothetical protein
VAELMSRLGHTTPTVVKRYQHATAERDHSIADKLGALMQAADLQAIADASSSQVARLITGA